LAKIRYNNGNVPKKAWKNLPFVAVPEDGPKTERETNDYLVVKKDRNIQTAAHF